MPAQQPHRYRDRVRKNEKLQKMRSRLRRDFGWMCLPICGLNCKAQQMADPLLIDSM